MSHSHSHAPGLGSSHSHGPQQPQQAIMPSPDPAVLALIDQDFHPVPLALGSNGATAVCEPHKLEKCDNCNLDFDIINRLTQLLVINPNLACPPPSNVVSQKLTQMVTAAKDEGNSLFKAGKTQQAIQCYSRAATLAIQRPSWEASQFMREELSTTVSNRSAAYFDARDYVSALADAETVIAVRRNWPKGHYRKAKALLGLARPKEAVDAVKLGLSYEPNNKELGSFLSEIEKTSPGVVA